MNRIGGTKSEERIKKFGEVFTPDSIVNDMLDLIKEQLPEDESYITKTFLEPSCGDGQFLIRILYRKLLQVQQLPVEQRQLALIKSLCSIYGIDIQEDNVLEARNRMFKIATGEEVSSFDRNSVINKISINLGINYSEQLKNVIKYILENNIIVGDTLKPSNDTNEVRLIAYHFNDNNGKVSLAKALLHNLDNEYDQSKEVDIMDMISIDNNDDVADFDF